MARCLVLGANGFLGSHIVDALEGEGHEVRAFGRFSHEPMFSVTDKVEVMRGDFLNRDDITRAVQGMDYVFHFISTTTPATAENDPFIDVDTNVRSSIILFEQCLESSVKRVIFASTGGAIYGDSEGELKSEVDAPEPISPYGIGKLTIEHFLRYFRIKHGLDSVVFRISNPYGERQPLHRKQGVIPIFLENICTDKPLTILGDGTMVRDYIYVKDMARMVATTFDKRFKYDVYNIGSGVGLTVKELVSAITDVSGIEPQINYAEAPTTYVHKVVLDVSRFDSEFKIATETKLEDGLRATLTYIKERLQNA